LVCYAIQEEVEKEEEYKVVYVIEVAKKGPKHVVGKTYGIFISLTNCVEGSI
jgi:hypothetical protein